MKETYNHSDNTDYQSKVGVVSKWWYRAV